MYIYKHTYPYIYTVYTQIHAHTHAHIYIYIHTHTHYLSVYLLPDAANPARGGHEQIASTFPCLPSSAYPPRS